ATCWGRRRSARGTWSVRARLRRRSSSSRPGSQCSQALRSVSREGAVARDQQAADSEHSLEQATNRTWSMTVAVQRELSPPTRRQERSNAKACCWTAEAVMVYSMTRKPPSEEGCLGRSHSRDGACVHLPPAHRFAG